MRLKILLLFTLLLVITGCGNSKPSDIRQEIWDEGLKHYIIINNTVESHINISEEQMQEISYFTIVTKPESKNEELLLKTLKDMAMCSWELSKIRSGNESKDDEIKSIVVKYLGLRETLYKEFKIK